MKTKQPRAIVILTTCEPLNDIATRQLNNVLLQKCNALETTITEIAGENLVVSILNGLKKQLDKTLVSARVSSPAIDNQIATLNAAYDYLSEACDGAICGKIFPTIPFMLKYHQDASVRESCELLATADKAVVTEWIHRCKNSSSNLYSEASMRQAITNATMLHSVMKS